MSGETLQIAEKRGEAKGKGEKESQGLIINSSSVINAKENNRMGKTRYLFQKIRDNKGTFHAKMGTIKDGNSMDLKEAEDIKKRWQECTEKLYKKNILMT